MSINREKPLNPYTAGNVVQGDSFIGREVIINRVQEELILPQQNVIVLFGQRRIGKTSLLFKLASDLPKDQFAAIYFDLSDKGDYSLKEVLLELAQTIINEFSIDYPIDQETFEFEKEFLPFVYKSLGERRPVILLDEFDVLDFVQESQRKNVAANEFLPYLRKLLVVPQQRLAFVIALGRKLEDLTSEAVNMFKSAIRYRVSVLKRPDAEFLIRFAERQNNLQFDQLAVNRIYELTSGHPYFTQLYCQVVYNKAWNLKTNGASIPRVTTQLVEEARDEVIDKGGNIFEWIWRGLPPAEKIIFSALANLLPTEASVATRQELTELLERNRLLIESTELADAPENLVRSELLRRDDNGNYRFFVELLRYWVKNEKPLTVTSREINQVIPEAEVRYQAAKAEFEAGYLDEAIQGFLRVIELNNAHLNARLGLAQAYGRSGKLDQAIEEYENLYKINPEIARSGLLLALLERIKITEKDGDWERVLKDSEKVLAISPVNPEIVATQKNAWIKLGDQSLEKFNFTEANNYYSLAGVVKEKQLEIQEQRHRFEVNQIKLAVIEKEKQLEIEEERHRLELNQIKVENENSSRQLRMRILWGVFFLLMFGFFVGMSFDDGFTQIYSLLNPSPTPSSTATPTPTSTETPAPTSTPTATSTSTPTPTKTNTPTPSNTPTSTYTPTPRPTSQIILTHPATINAISISLDGNLLATGDSIGNVIVWDINRNNLYNELSFDASVSSLDFSPTDNLNLAVGLSNGSIEIINVESGSNINRLNGHINSVHFLEFSLNRNFIVSGSMEIVNVWDLSKSATDDPIREYLNNNLLDLTLSPDGNFLAFSDDSNLHVWDLESNKEVLFEDNFGVYYMDFSSDSKTLVSYCTYVGNRLCFWTLIAQDSGEIIWSFDPGDIGNFLELNYSTEGGLIAHINSNLRISIMDATNQDNILTLGSESSNTKLLEVSPNGELLISVNQSNEIILWNLSQDGFKIMPRTSTPTATITPTQTLTPTVTQTPTPGPSPTPTLPPPLPPTFTLTPTLTLAPTP